MTPADHLHRVIFRIPSEYADPFATALETHMDSVAWTAGEGGTTAQITGFAEDIVDKSAISDAIAATADGINTSAPDIEFSRIRVQNWVAENIQQFSPIIAGRFFVHGSEYQKPNEDCSLASSAIPFATRAMSRSVIRLPGRPRLRLW